MDIVKEDIKTGLSNPDGNIRLLIATTSATGMGVNCCHKRSYYFGPPKEMDTFVQQFGRAGRDGGQATSLLLYISKQCRKLGSDIPNFTEMFLGRRFILNFASMGPFKEFWKNNGSCNVII